MIVCPPPAPWKAQDLTLGASFESSTAPVGKPKTFRSTAWSSFLSWYACTA
jgi:hypothetical protein